MFVGAFNQEKALVGAFSVIVQLSRLIVSSEAVLASSELQSGVKQPVTRQWGKKWVQAEKWDGCLYAGSSLKLHVSHQVSNQIL